MTRAGYSVRSTRPRIAPGVALAVAFLHLGLIVALVHAFSPDLGARIASQVLETIDVTVAPPPPKPSLPVAPAQVARAAERTGAAAPAGPRSEAVPVAAPSARIVLATQAAAPVAGQGNAATAGASSAGQGTGAGGQGSGTGSGNAGSGTGVGGGAKVVKIAGDISAARDYPPATRELRLGDYVIVALTVGTDGRVKACRVHRASKDPQSDQITCRLATERFRFKPATDAAGNPVEAVYGWQQRWFDPKEKL
jgi:protein TonB